MTLNAQPASQSSQEEQQFETALREVLGDVIRKPVSARLGFKDENGIIILKVPDTSEDEPEKYYFHSAFGQEFVGQAFLKRAALEKWQIRYDAPIRIQKDALTGDWVIIGIDMRYAALFFNDVDGNDPDFVKLEQFAPGLLGQTFPASMKVQLYSAPYTFNGEFKDIETKESIDWSDSPNDDHIPDDNNQSRAVLVELDFENEVLVYSYGAEFSSEFTLRQMYRAQKTEGHWNYLPKPSLTNFRGGYVKLTKGMTSIKAAQIWSIHEVITKESTDTVQTHNILNDIVCSGGDVVTSAGTVVWSTPVEDDDEVPNVYPPNLLIDYFFEHVADSAYAFAGGVVYRTTEGHEWTNISQHIADAGYAAMNFCISGGFGYGTLYALANKNSEMTIWKCINPQAPVTNPVWTKIMSFDDGYGGSVSNMITGDGDGAIAAWLGPMGVYVSEGGGAPTLVGPGVGNSTLSVGLPASTDIYLGLAWTHAGILTSGRTTDHSGSGGEAFHLYYGSGGIWKKVFNSPVSERPFPFVKEINSNFVGGDGKMILFSVRGGSNMTRVEYWDRQPVDDYGEDWDTDMIANDLQQPHYLSYNSGHGIILAAEGWQENGIGFYGTTNFPSPFGGANTRGDSHQSPLGCTYLGNDELIYDETDPDFVPLSTRTEFADGIVPYRESFIARDPEVDPDPFHPEIDRCRLNNYGLVYGANGSISVFAQWKGGGITCKKFGTWKTASIIGNLFAESSVTTIVKSGIIFHDPYYYQVYPED